MIHISVNIPCNDRFNFNFLESLNELNYFRKPARTYSELHRLSGIQATSKRHPLDDSDATKEIKPTQVLK